MMSKKLELEVDLNIVAAKMARILKIRELRRTPGMDEVAVKLNSVVTEYEVERARNHVNAFIEAGYELHRPDGSA